MSNISLEGNASGTGTFTIAAPNTNSNFTITLPQATGTLILSQAAGGVSTNTAVGTNALAANTTGANNTAVGYGALDACTTGPSNTSIGENSLGVVTTGQFNLGLGKNSGGVLTTGSNNIYIGLNARASASGVAKEMVIGSSDTADIDGKGNNTGFINNGGGGTFQGNNNASWSTTSDQRLKKNIVDNTEGLEKITGIQVRNFEYRLPEEITEVSPKQAILKTGVQLGVIAQELQQVCPDCVTEQSTGVLSVDTDEIFWHMVNAIKQLNAKVTALEAQLATPPATPSAEPNA